MTIMIRNHFGNTPGIEPDLVTVEVALAVPPHRSASQGVQVTVADGQPDQGVVIMKFTREAALQLAAKISILPHKQGWS
jgi:hypothetical protein